MGSERRKILRELESARKGLFPHRTCPASRHVHMIVEGMLDPKTDLYKALHGFEPEHMAGSIASVLESLWKARRWMRWQPNDERDYFGGEWVPDIEAIAASAGEAGTAETAKTGSVHEHATAATSGGDARKDHP